MKNSEIRALVDEALDELTLPRDHQSTNLYKLATAANILLARQAEALGRLATIKKHDFATELGDDIRAILDPQETIRDIADRHGFAPMPPELGQRNIDDHTTTAALAKEKTNG